MSRARSGRIAVVGACPYPVPQGSQVYLRETALAWQAAGHEPHLVTYGYGEGEDDSGLTVHRAANVPGARKTSAGPSFAKPALDVLLVAELRRVVSEHKIDVVNAHNIEGLAVALAAGYRPIVYHAHNAMADELPHYFADKNWSETAGAWLDDKLPRRADAIVVPHERLRTYLVDQGCAADAVHVVPPPIDAAVFEPAEHKRRDAPVLYAGNLDEYQNLPLLEEAMPLVLAREPGTQLVVATHGTGHIEGARHERLTDSASLARVLKREAVFACPRTSWSGYPIKILNAMAAGLPVVCCEGSASAITHQYNGLVVPDNDAPQFAESLLRLIHDPELRAIYGRRGRETVLEKHNRATAAEALNSVLASVL